MGSTYRILVVEDDNDINNLLKTLLTRQGYEVLQAFSGTEGRMVLAAESVNLVILDLMLPGMSGEELLAVLRKEQKLSVPVLILSAKSALEDKVQLLMGGADDYLTKPFEPEELLARVCVMLRRQAPNMGGETYHYKQLELNEEARTVFVCDSEITLTPHEFAILLLLVKSPNTVFSREKLYELVWENGYYGEDNTVNVHVSNIRKKIAALDSTEEYIKTVWGIGFKLC